MDPIIVVGGMSLVGVIVTALFQYLKGNKNDRRAADNEGTRISQHGLITLAEQLRIELARVKTTLAESESENHDLREENSELLDKVAALNAALRGQEIVTQEFQGRVAHQSRLIADLRAQNQEREDQ